MHMVLAPVRKKSEAKAVGEAAKQAKAEQRAANAAADKQAEAQLREAAKNETTKKKKGPADNLDPDIEF